MTWLSRHSAAIQAAAAAITAITAVLAVVGVLLQMQAADETSRAQTAREAYSAHLALAVGNPAFAAPSDACALARSDKGAAYVAYVDHLLYAAEQMLETEEGWSPVFIHALIPHAALLCDDTDQDDSTAFAALLTDFHMQVCPAVPDCTTAQTAP